MGGAHSLPIVGTSELCPTHGTKENYTKITTYVTNSVVLVLRTVMCVFFRIISGSSQSHSEENRGTTFRSSTDEIFETLTWNNKTR